ncbi:MAG: hypothetical protein B5M54_10780 [Candidatus Aminicenantes bacterium 4484_214]|nr:MAG: hypothetical protein B5M54_10780 [Candidatus Aminicenantes bacterium 4484_214]RLE09957.1 MAG: hypothetical protein DRJ06_01885 [Candidatus Aminicenantes bacterium]
MGKRLTSILFMINMESLRKDIMKDLWKSLFTLLAFSSAFVIGFYLGKEKVLKKIPEFQEELETK